jgi:Dynein heavy chain, N-terminal region 1
VKIEVAKSGLCASLLVENPDDEELYLNFDSEILTLFRDTECMIRFGLEIPLAARVLMTKQTDFKHLVNSMVVSDDVSIQPRYIVSSFLGSR